MDLETMIQLLGKAVTLNVITLIRSAVLTTQILMKDGEIHLVKKNRKAKDTMCNIKINVKSVELLEKTNR